MHITLGLIQSVAAIAIALGSLVFLSLFWQFAAPGNRRSLGVLTTVFGLMVVARFAELLPSLRWVAAIADLAIGGTLLWRAWAIWPDRHRLSQSFALLRSGIGPVQMVNAAGRFDSLFSSAGLGIALRDSASGQVIECNQRYLEIVGRRQSTLLRSGGQEWTKPEFVKIEADHRRRLIAREIPGYELTKQITLPDGTMRWVRVWASLANAGSKTMDVLADVDREMIARLDRDQSIARLENANHELEGVGYAIAHDIKAPLRRIRQRLQLALSLIGDQQLSKITEAIALIDRLNEFIEQLLEYSRLDRDSEMTLMSVSIGEIAQSIAYQLEGDASFVIDPDLPKVRCNPAQIERIFINLYSNAIKHGHGNPVITVTGRVHQYMVAIDIADNGPGIDPGVADSLFQLFIRGEDSNGSGLGLAICQKIAIAHGGSISLIPSEQGACFRLVLPLI